MRYLFWKRALNCGHSTYLFIYLLLRHIFFAAFSARNCLLGCFLAYVLYFMFAVNLFFVFSSFFFPPLLLLNVFVWEAQHSTLCIRHCVAVRKVCTCTSSQTRGCNESRFVRILCFGETLFRYFALNAPLLYWHGQQGRLKGQLSTGNFSVLHCKNTPTV